MPAPIAAHAGAATSRTPKIASGDYGARLLAAVDSVPETRGIGVKIAEGGHMVTLRGSPPGEPFMIVDLRPPLRPALAATPARPAESPVNVGREWLGLAVNVGGATLSWIGVVGTAAAAPETGGLSLAGTVVMWTGAVSSSVLVGNSIARLTAIYTGHSGLVNNADHNMVYLRTNDALDFAGIFGAGGALKEAVVLDKAVGKAGFRTFDIASAKALSRPARRELTRALELQGAKRVAAARITLIVRMKLINAFAAAYGVSVSSYNGAIHDVAILIAHPDKP